MSLLSPTVVVVVEDNGGRMKIFSAERDVARLFRRPGPAELPVTRDNGCGLAILGRSPTRHPSRANPGRKPAGAAAPASFPNDQTIGITAEVRFHIRSVPENLS